ncbi:MAG: ABC transporter substrate-binding protein [Bacteriovoracaceae bacterium]|jgi:dipeptide transport system substrate-binding protein|nr:ABC transporter substrate-binding protein [Bacteriovoracaceae bacterium]
MRILLLCLLVILGCSKKANKGDGKLLVYCSEGSPTAFNPQIITDGTTSNAVTKPVYNRLIEFEYGKTSLTPGLASSWDVSEDKLSYVFHLKKGIKFHTTKYFTPTRDFNADDVIFSILRQKDPTHPYHKVSGGSYDYFKGMEMDSLLSAVQKVDDYTVKLVLSRPNAPFLANMAMGFMSILSKEYADKLASAGKMEDIDQMPIGTGPFIYEKYTKDTLIRYKANKEYFGETPKIDKLVFSITPDASVRFQKLKTGECHFVTYPAPQDIKAMKKLDGIKVLEDSGLNVGYLAMNVTKGPLATVKVRQAINHALNRESYIESIYLGQGMKATAPLPPTMWGHNKNLAGYKHDPELAKNMLAEAGYPKGFETTLWVLPVARPYIPNGKKLGEMMQADLARVGIKAEIVTYDWGTYLSKSKKGDHGLIQLGWTGDNGDPDNFLHVLLGCASVDAGSNVARWCNDDFNNLIEQAQRETDIKVRTKLYLKAQEIFKAQAPWATIAHSKVFKAMSKNLSGYKMDPLGHDIFTWVEFK